MPVRYILSSMWIRWGIFPQLSIIQYVGLRVFSLPISLVMIERIYILCLIIIIKSEVWTIAHCLGLGHETMVSAVCLSVFLSTHVLCPICKRRAITAKNAFAPELQVPLLCSEFYIYNVIFHGVHCVCARCVESSQSGLVCLGVFRVQKIWLHEIVATIHNHIFAVIDRLIVTYSKQWSVGPWSDLNRQAGWIISSVNTFFTLCIKATPSYMRNANSFEVAVMVM